MTTPYDNLPTDSFAELKVGPNLIRLEEDRGPYINPAHVTAIASNGGMGCVVKMTNNDVYQSQMSAAQMVSRLADEPYDPKADPNGLDLKAAREAVGPQNVQGQVPVGQDWTPSGNLSGI